MDCRAVRIVYEYEAAAPTGLCFRVAANVECWPDILRHYRRARFLRRDGFATGLVEMAAWRPLGPIPIGWPVWWLSEMHHDVEQHRVIFQHVYGITSGMNVLWEMTPIGAATSRIRVLYEWCGPAWPLIGRLAADWVIGPVLVRAIAKRTLVGVALEAERRHRHR